MSTPLRLLVLGGTSWLGGRVAALARDQGLDVTCLARGTSGSTPPRVRHVVADRTDPDAYREVGAQDWDAVVDVSRQPSQVRSALTSLASRARHWVFVSTCSVYADHAAPGQDEEAPLLPAWSGTGEAPGELYGEAKVACEDACRTALPEERLLIARAGLLCGAGDRSDRFGYWSARTALAADPGREQVLVPPLDGPVQVLDVDDLAGWLLRAAQAGSSGTVDAVGTDTDLRGVVEACARAAGVRPALVPVEERWLLDQGVQPWMGPESLPLWLPSDEYGGLMARRRHRAMAAGLVTRPLAETAAATLAWERAQGLHRERGAGLSAAREAALLAAASLS